MTRPVRRSHGRTSSADARFPKTALARLGVLGLALLVRAPAIEAGFQTTVNYVAGDHPVHVAVGDFNGDGKQDLVVVNNDPNSSQYREWAAFTLSDSNHLQVLVPPNFGNGHLVMSERAISTS